MKNFDKIYRKISIRVELPEGELGLVPQEVRFKLLEYLLKKGLRAKDLGISSAYLFMLRRKRKVSAR